jgi:hypothetical protein
MLAAWRPLPTVERTAGLGIGERRLGAESDLGNIDSVVPAEDSRRTGVDAAAIHHRRIKDRDGTADAGGDAEVRGGVVTDEVDHRHLRRTAHNRPRRHRGGP